MKSSSQFILAIVLLSIVLGSTMVFSEPGSEDDPLVTLSYFNREMDKLKSYIDSKIPVEGGVEASNKLEVVELESGQTLIGDGGTEIILRGGKATIIAGELGGLSDITDGKDLKMGELIPANHLLIIPRNDGRGAYVVENAIFLVRGDYKIK